MLSYLNLIHFFNVHDIMQILFITIHNLKFEVIRINIKQLFFFYKEKKDQQITLYNRLHKHFQRIMSTDPRIGVWLQTIMSHNII